MGMEVVGLEATGSGAIEAVGRFEPDLVLLDLGLPDRNGLDVGREILASHPATTVVALTAFEDPLTAANAIGSGFTGYITKSVHMEQFASAIRRLTSGEIVMPQQLARPVGASRNGSVHQPGSLLTRRELEVLQLLSQGVPSRSIAGRLGVSPNTVRTHVQGILTKLQVHSRLEAVAYATSNGLVSEAS
jgi:DNA-binding NarL/FixJ family response regulator